MEKRFNYYTDFRQFTIGITISETYDILEWDYFIGLDIGFISVWVYFNLKL